MTAVAKLARDWVQEKVSTTMHLRPVSIPGDIHSRGTSCTQR